ncbi:MAG TPA: VCBS repeat-containing protein, partial [Pyrinomonadaceae bacterium]|nr:VCBS repeat-containing protein [Pyrinomonadaceae bacterium]
SWIAPGDDGAVGTAADYDVFFTSTQPNARPLLLPTKLLPAPAGTAQSVTVTAPYRNFSGTITLRTYDNAGNSSDTVTSVAIPLNSGSDPYTVALSNPSALSTGGTSLSLLVGDDRFIENYQLPFAFPFYGKMRSKINISTNGALYFSRIPRDANDPATGTDAGSSIEGLAVQEMIAGMWDDLRTDGVAGGGVYVVQPNADTIIFRWQGKTFNTPEQPINFEIELRRDGTIVMRYGAGQAAPINTRLFPVVGISAGEPDAYVIESHTSTALINLTNAQTVTLTPRIDSIGLKSPFDFDGDGKTDLSIFRPSVGEWWYLRSSDGSNRTFQFGSSSDKLVPADYTGDGKTDIAFFRPQTGEWFILRSEDNSFYSFPFGASGDIPVPADFDGDGKADAAVYRPSNQTWFISRSSGGTTIQTFGIAGDIPVTADYDGDGKSDLAIYRPSQGQWWLLRSSLGIVVYQFGNSTDKLVQGDYTGDGKTDVAFFRPSTGEWFILRSENNSFYSFPFGASGDIPSPGDYDGDGKFDAAVFRPLNQTWFAQRSTSGTLIQGFGI